MVTSSENVKGDVMTNKEKFIETFGFEPDRNVCIAPTKVCDEVVRTNPDVTTPCVKCPFKDWIDKEYKECFRMRGDL